MGKNLRDFLNEISSTYLEVNREVPLDYIGALTGQADTSVLFTNIKAFPGWRVCDQLFKNRMLQGKVLGVDADNVVPAISNILKKGPVEPQIVKDGPVKEIVLKGEEADLTTLPVPIQTNTDPGPYINGFNILKDLDTGVYNSCYTRTLVKGPRKAVSSYVTSDSNRILKQYKEKGELMPQAICIGHHPAVELAVNFSGKDDTFHEIELAGSILGEPIEMVQCETLDLMVPAESEIVIEGYIHPDRLEDDGPSPSPNLYFAPYLQKQPFFEVTCITMRKDPVYRNFQSTPYTDHQPLPRLFHEAIIYNRLKEMKVDVHDVFFPAWGGVLSLIIQMTPKVDGEVNDVLLNAMGSSWPNTKKVVVVDRDIDIYNSEDVYYALSTRTDPSNDVIIIPKGRGSAMDPTSHIVQEDSPSIRTVGKWGIDATKPLGNQLISREFQRAWPKYWEEIELKDFLS
ncbi:UbiD family decarboxylase [Alteribacillus sp. YIM 98480]|uniref:UbiD family decarboxylase n=1 Tax=Alteribacillus sp. YIM 98480 TaxID=2606599 RepID=UPI00131C7CC8|nr:UbiD family decarboxylase [Alteribacillus sp. YIM 98480]